MYAALIGLMVESERVKNITDMTKKLDDLKEAFHERFSISELLSMYEGLRPAPPLFWEEYLNSQTKCNTLLRCCHGKKIQACYH